MKRMLKLLLALLITFAATAAGEDVLKKAESLKQAKKYAQALKLLRESLDRDRYNVNTHEMIQEILLETRDKQQVIAQYKDQYEKAPSALNAHLYGTLLESPSEREQLFREIRDEHPQEVWGYQGLANALLDQDRLQEAAFVAEEGIPYVRSPAGLHYVAARIYRRMKDYRKASEHAALTYKAHPNPEYKEFMQAYEWIEVAETEDPEAKDRLAKKYYEKYRKELSDADDFGTAVSLTELAFIFAENDLQTMEHLTGRAQKIFRELKPLKDTADQQLASRAMSALYSLRALAEAEKGKHQKAMQLLARANEAGEGSEAFYFQAKTHDKLGDKNAALTAAIKATTYPPSYSRAADFASRLWQEVHGSDTGFAEATEKQKAEFAPQRKERVLSNMISEDHQDFILEDRSGNKVTAKELNGKIILMNFWAVWCPPCREELPHWNAFYAKHKNDPELSLVAVGDEPWETMINYMKNQNLDFPVYKNEDYWDQFSVDGIPTLLVIDRNGKIRFRNVGFEKGMEYEETLQWQIEAVKKQQ